MRKVVYQCDTCKKEINKMVIFEATDLNIWDRPIYCKECAVIEFTEWISAKLGNGHSVSGENMALVINPSLNKLNANIENKPR